MFPSGIGTVELVVFATIVLLLFGNRLPAVMRSVGASIQEFRKALQSGETTSIES
jgi:sec-independent protein translocase protein TatA